MAVPTLWQTDPVIAILALLAIGGALGAAFGWIAAQRAHRREARSVEAVLRDGVAQARIEAEKLRSALAERSGLLTALEEARAGLADSEERLAAAEARLAALAEGELPGAAPPPMEAPMKGGADPLQRIRGIGPGTEAALQAMGIFHYAQVAAWAEAEARHVDARLALTSDRVTLDGWVAQSRDLLAPPPPEFSNREDDPDL